MSESRKDVLVKALEAEVGSESVDLGTLFTDDVVGWSPYATVSGLTALAELSALREMAFSNVVIMLRGLDEVGNKAFAEWLIEADHTGPLVLGEDAVVGSDGTACPAGRRHRGRLPRWEDPVVPDLLRRHLADRADRRRLTSPSRWSSMSRIDPDPLDIEFLEAQIRREASPPWDSVTKSSWRSSCATPARSSPASAGGHGATAASCRASGSRRASEVAGSGTRLLAAAEAEAAARGMLADRPLHLRLPGSSSLRAKRLRTRGSSPGLPLGNRRSLVPQAPEPTGQTDKGCVEGIEPIAERTFEVFEVHLF